jgi:predicted  nucleic acid-binding Zn-ribbon protein
MAKATPSSENSDKRSGELENLREILFGNQVRATETRLDQLEEHLQVVQRDFSAALSKQSEALNKTAEAAQKELPAQINHQAKTTQANQQALEDSILQLRSETKKQLEELNSSVTQALEKLREMVSEQVRRAQSESRQRDDDLRQEMLALGSMLDNKLTPRNDLAQLLIEVGQNLKTNAGESSDSAEKA